MEEVVNGQEKPSGWLYEWAEALVYAILFVSFIFIFVGRIVGVSGSSMYPTLDDLDTLVISHLFFEAEYGDIVVFTKEEYMAEPMVKRIIATEGQEIDIDFDTGNVFVDGKLLDEDYINERTYNDGDMDYPQIVPEGHVFVMGDNRNRSTDSRVSSVGMIDTDLILGEVVFRLMPFDKIGVVE